MEKGQAAEQGALERVREWLKSWPGCGKIGEIRADYTDQTTGGGMYPRGITELGRSRDILGGAAVRQRLDFKLNFVLPKAPGEDLEATENAEWLLEFQQWVQRQSAEGLAPRFGNTGQENEKWTAAGGSLQQADEGGFAVYTAALSTEFTIKYEVI